MPDSPPKPSRTPDSGSSHTLEIAHVLFTDIVGYSKLPMDKQEKLLMQFQDTVRQTVEFARAQADDQLIRLPTGDGMALVFFGDAEAPVRCAVEIGRSLRHQPALQLRMGIHTGPVYRVADINANRNVAGGGINIAQRVMDCGDAGHILVSSAEADVLCQVSAWCSTLHDLGEVEVKHGVLIHLYNLYTEEAGNPELPKKLSTAQATLATEASAAKRKKLSTLMIAGISAMAIVSVGGWLYYTRNAHALGVTDTIVLADFTNTTGDAVFDGALRQGLAVQLEQSPFLSLISEQRIQQTLQMMNQSPDVRLTPEIARGVCQRTRSAAVLGGSIAQIGAQYSLIIKAVNCSNGETLASAESQASDKNHVLGALGKIATDMRTKLGESLGTVQRLDTPLEQATTSSLEALQAYSLGWKTMVMDNAVAVPLFQRAIRLDPNFAMAYATLGTSYYNLGQTSPAAVNTRKAYELRERVSEREKFYIESHYHDLVTGDLENSRQACELWAQTYPRDFLAPYDLGATYANLGQYDKALAEMREAFRLNPGSGSSYVGVVTAYVFLNRLVEARTAAEEAQLKKLDSPFLHVYLYQLAFLQNDAARMAQQVAWSAGKPGVEDILLASEADTTAYSGQLGKAREFSRRAVASAERGQEKETAANYEADAALREALFGIAAEARHRATAALGLSTGRDVQYGAALALALVGDSRRAQALADDLGKRFPEDTIVQFNYLPTIRAQLTLSRNDSSKAIEALQAAAPYELGTPAAGAFSPALYPVYVRGEEYLAGHQGSEAAVEFQKILDHRGVVQNEPIGALAHLGLARAYTLEAKSAQGLDAESYKLRARAAYQEFLTLWRDADTDIRLLKEARAEYAKLQ